MTKEAKGLSLTAQTKLSCINMAVGYRRVRFWPGHRLYSLTRSLRNLDFEEEER